MSGFILISLIARAIVKTACVDQRVVGPGALQVCPLLCYPVNTLLIFYEILHEYIRFKSRFVWAGPSVHGRTTPFGQTHTEAWVP